MKVYPDELTVIFYYNLSVSIIAAIVGVISEPNASAWKIGLDTSLTSILCSVGLGIRSHEEKIQNFNLYDYSSTNYDLYNSYVYRDFLDHS